MATVKGVIIKNEKKDDGTWNVKIRVTHKGKPGYISTSHFVIAKQLTRDFKIKDTFIIDLINPTLAKYRKIISEMGLAIEFMTVKEITTKLKDSEEKPQMKDVDFAAFCAEYIQELREADRNSSADNMQTVLNSISDFFNSGVILASQVTANRLREYEKYLRSKRTLLRKNQFGNTVKTVKPGMTSGVHNYMRDLRLMFYEARDRFNDEDMGLYRIPHNPFRKYKVEEAPEPKKRNLTIAQIRAIRDCNVQPDTRAELGRDLFMLSFYLCGMNAKDFYLFDRVKQGRVEYCRSKTAARRRDRAFISIKAVPEAIPLIAKHLGTLKNRYACSDSLNTALNKGLKEVAEMLRIPNLTFYYARHTFGDSARNLCRFSKDDVGLAMNHIDQTRRTTDKYISPNWSIIDDVQAGVIRLLKGEES